MDLVDAVVPLVSALIGGVISGCAVFMQMRHDARLERERRDHETQIALAEKREEFRQAAEQAADDAKVAARILQADIQLARVRIDAAARSQKFWSAHFDLPMNSWERYREVVAQYLDLQAWANVSLCFRSFASLESQAAAARVRRDARQRPELSDTNRRSVELAQRRVTTALAALEEFTQDHTQVLDEADEVVADDA